MSAFRANKDNSNPGNVDIPEANSNAVADTISEMDSSILQYKIRQEIDNIQSQLSLCIISTFPAYFSCKGGCVLYTETYIVNTFVMLLFSSRSRYMQIGKYTLYQ